MKKRASIWPLALALAAGLLPTLGVALRAVADEPEPQPAKPAESREMARKRVLAAMAGNATALINVSGRELPASPDILALGRRGTGALSRCLADNADDKVRRSCAVMLGWVGDRAALPALHTALDDWEADVRQSVVEALARIPDPSSIDPLVKLFGRKDETAAVRTAVLEALGAIGHKKAVAVLRKELARKPDDGDGLDLRLAAFDALWRSRHVMSRETLIGDAGVALESKKDPLVLAATLAAADLRSPRLTAKLVPLMDHANASIRNKAVYALGLIGDKTAEKALLEKLPGVRDGRMLNNIAFALERLDKDGFYASIRQVIEHKQAVIRLNAAFVLGDVERPEGLPLLEKALGDPSDLVKTSAAVALGKIADARALPALEKLTGSENPSLREEAIYAVFATSGKKRGDIVYDKLFAPTGDDSKTRAQQKKRAAITLGKIGDVRVRDYLLGCLEQRKCAPSQVEVFVRGDKDPSVPGRLLLDWARGHESLTPLLADLRPAGTLPLAASAAESAVARGAIDDAESAIDLVGDLGDADARARLGRLHAAPPMSDPWLEIHTLTALARLGETSAEAALLTRMDTVAAVWLPRLAGILGRIQEKPVRDRLTPPLLEREKGDDANIALAAAAVRLAWDPEAAVFRLLEALASPSVKERDLADRYLARAKDPKVTWLLRRALAREGRDDVKDRLRSLLDRRRDEK